MWAVKSFNKLSNISKKLIKHPSVCENNIKLVVNCVVVRNASNSTEKFWELLAKRRKEACRSVVVQVHSSQSCPELYSYCSQFGSIIQMQHYTAGSDQMHFVIVEFEDEDSVADVLATSQHVSNNDTLSVPVQSQFLWFRANGKGNKKQTTITTKEIPISFTEFGTKLKTREDINTELSTAKNISEQMIILHNMVSLSETGSRLRYLACRQIELALSGMFANCRAIPFGSSVNSFGKEGCDLDIVVRLNNSKVDNASRLAFQTKAIMSSERSQTLRQMECIADLLQLFLPGCANVRRILQAKVPIIKYNHEQTKLECDLSMSNMTGVYMSDLLYTLANIDERVRPLVFTVRRWAQQMGLTSNSPGRWITNFSLTLMVIFFLQRVHILPTIKLLMALSEPNDAYITEDGINCSFLHDLTKLPILKTNTDSLNILLLQFYEYYSKFDFTHHALSLNDGREVHKPDSSPLYIVNPLERHFNVSKNVSVEELERLRIEFRNAAWVLESQESPKLSAGNPNWGLLELFKSPLQKTVQLKSIPNRLVEIQGLFDQHGGDGDSEPVFKNSEVKQEINKIKIDTVRKIKNMGSKVRVRRR